MKGYSELFGRDVGILLEDELLRPIRDILGRLTERALSHDENDYDPAKILEDILDSLKDDYVEEPHIVEIEDPRGSFRPIRSKLKHVHDSYNTGYNLIPSNSKIYGCTDLLVVICHRDSKFEDYLLQCFKHTVLDCPKCKKIVFITSTWNSKIFGKHKASVKMVRDKGTSLNFLYLGSRGLRNLPE